MTEKDQKLLIEDRKVFMRNFTIMHQDYMLLKDERDELAERFECCKRNVDYAIDYVTSDKCSRLSKDVKETLLRMLGNAYKA